MTADSAEVTAAPTVQEIARLLDAARAAINRYQLEEGAALLEQARGLVAAGAPAPAELSLRIGITGSWLTFEREGIAAAAAQLESLERDSRAAGEWGLVGVCALQHGILLTRTGELQAALARMRAAGAQSPAMRPEDRVRLALSRGTLLYQLGEWGRAAQDFRAAAEAAQAAGLQTQQFKALHNQGCAAFVQGDLPLALRLMDEAETHRGDVNPGLTLIDRARVLAEAGLVHDATAALQESGAAFAAAGLRREVVEIDVDLARCELLLGLPEAAAHRAARAADAFDARAEPYWASRARLVGLQALAFLPAPSPPPRVASDGTDPAPPGEDGVARRVAMARGLAEAAAARGDQTISQLAAVELAEALCDGGQAGDAGPLGEAAAALAGAQGLTRSPYLGARLGYAHARVRSDLVAGRVGPARARLTRAARDLAGAQRRTAGLDARTALAVHGRRLAALDLELALGRRRDPIAVLHCVERWRRAIAPLTPVRPPADPQEAQLLGRLRQARESLSQAGSDELAQARAEVRRLERVISRARWRTPGPDSGPGGREPSYGDLRAAVAAAHGQDTAVLGLVTSHDRALGLVAPVAGRARLVDLGPAPDLRRLVERVCCDTSAAAHAAHNPHLEELIATAAARSVRALDEALAPALDVVATQRLVVLDGAGLGVIPWGLLPSRRGLATTLAPSLSSWANQPDGPGPHPASAGPLVAALAGPGVPHGAAEAARVHAAWLASAPPGVAGGDAGLLDAGGRGAGGRGAGGRGADGVGAECLEAALATQEDLLAALATHDVVHVAAHGSHQPESPLFSCLSLADGPVFAYELESRPLSAQLVVLSACEAGRASARWGEEALGWPAALLALGARSVVAPVADVRDDDTCTLMVALHAGLTRGQDVAQALAAAAAEVSGGTSFVCFGAPWAR